MNHTFGLNQVKVMSKLHLDIELNLTFFIDGMFRNIINYNPPPTYLYASTYQIVVNTYIKPVFSKVLPVF